MPARLSRGTPGGQAEKESILRQEFEPLLHPVEIIALRPTQMTVGMREVAHKRAEWRKIAARDGQGFLGRHMLPVVRGPKKRLSLIDNHHLAPALHEEKSSTCWSAFGPT